MDDKNNAENITREIGEILIKFGEAAFTGMVIGVMVKADKSNFLLLALGLAITISACGLGLFLEHLGRNKDE
jgi:hypothetical protein